MQVRELTGEGQREAAVPIMQQLWTDRDRADILDWTGEEGYRLFGAFDEGTLVGLAGVRIDDFLHHHRHVWLYDFVVDEPRRGDGIGTELLAHVESWARDRECESLALASPLDGDEVHQYYRQRGFEQWGYVIERDL